MTQPFEPPEALVEQVAHWFWVAYHEQREDRRLAARRTAETVLRALAPAIIDAGIRQRVAAMQASDPGDAKLLRNIPCAVSPFGNWVYEADLLRALGVEP